MDWDRRRYVPFHPPKVTLLIRLADLMTGEGGKAIDRLTDQVGHPREDTTLDTDVRRLGIDLVCVVTHGCHPVEAMDVQEVVHLPIIDVAPEPLPSKAEALGLVRTGEGVLLFDDSLRGERIDPDPLSHHGAPSLLTAKADRVTYLVAAAAQGVFGMHRPGAKSCAQLGGIPLPKVRSAKEAFEPSPQERRSPLRFARRAPLIPSPAETCLWTQAGHDLFRSLGQSRLFMLRGPIPSLHRGGPLQRRVRTEA